MKSSTSDLLIANCDNFIYYDDLVRKAKRTPRATKKTPPRPARSRRPLTAW